MTGTERTWILLRHPKHGDRKITQPEYALLKEAMNLPKPDTNTLKGKLGWARGTIDNRFSRIIGELQVGDRVEALNWFREAIVVGVNAEPERRLPITQNAPINLIDPSLTQHKLALEAIQRQITFVFMAMYISMVVFVFGFIAFYNAEGTKFNDWSNFYSIAPLCGGIAGLFILNRANARDEAYYLPVIIMCIGMIVWSIGGFIWLYFNVFGISPEPYPGLPDWLGFIPGGVGFLIACILLHSKITRDRIIQLILIVVAACLFAPIIFILMFHLRDWRFFGDRDPGKIILDVGYPTIDFVCLLLLLFVRMTAREFIASRGLTKTLWIVIIGMFSYLLSDLSFGVTTTLPDDSVWSYHPGKFADFLFATSFVVLSLGIINIPIQASREAT